MSKKPRLTAEAITKWNGLSAWDRWIALGCPQGPESSWGRMVSVTMIYEQNKEGACRLVDAFPTPANVHAHMV